MNVFEALKAGKSLARASTWANVQGATQGVKAVLAFAAGAGAFFFGVDLHVSDQVVDALSVGVASLVWGGTELWHLYLTFAANKEAGLRADGGGGAGGASGSEPGALG